LHVQARHLRAPARLSGSWDLLLLVRHVECRHRATARRLEMSTRARPARQASCSTP